MKQYHERKRTGRKKSIRLLSVMLCLCLLITACPYMPGAAVVQAAEKVENSTDFVIQALLERIAVLPNVGEYLATEPNMDDGDTYAEWEEKLYEYAEESLAIWEDYEVLTEEQQEQMPEEELAKLTAWVEIAETLSDHAVMLADDSGHHASWTALSTDNTSATELSSGNYYLAKSVSMGTITIKGEVTLCLNGKTLTHSGEAGSVIVVGENAKFTLCDCQDHWYYESSFDNSTKTYSCSVAGEGGCITGGNGNNSQGGGVYVNSGATFNMNSGRITGCNVGIEDKHFGGGVYVSGGTFNMSGGFIDGNKAENSGGVYLNHAIFTMSGNAVIMDNESKQVGGVNLAEGSSFNMTSGYILGNKGGNTAGAIMIGGSSASFKMSGGSIQHNIGNTEAAGGIRMLAGTLEVSGNIRISDNYGWNGANNLSLARGCTITVTGGLSNDIGVTWRPARKPLEYPVLVATGTNSRSISDADWSHFSSDNKTYEIQKKETTDTGNELYLAEPGSCDLGGLDLSASGATLSPSFDPDTTRYTSTVANSVDEVGITATLADTASEADITIKINDGSETPMDSGVKKTVNLAEGENTIVITVTSVTSETSEKLSKAYTIKITREEAPASFTVTLHGNGGSAGTALTTYTYGTGATLPKDWARTGYTFSGWYDNEECTGTEVKEISATATGDKEYWAKWTPNSYTVTLHGNGGSAGTALTTYTYGTKVTLPKDWTRTGYSFAGWYDNKSCTGTKVENISATATGDKEYWAGWTPTSYSISYDLDDGAVTGNPTSYTIENSAITLINPTKTGYSFGGWSGTDLTGSNNMSVTIAAGSTGNREYKAHWTAADYTVTLNGNEGQGGTSLISYAHGTGATLPTDWTRAGYNFAGWYDNENCTGTEVTEISATATGNKEYWAKWTPLSYTITYVLDGGNVSGNPASYTIEDSAITINNPTREGYTFTGWGGTDLTGNNNMSVTIASGSTGNRTYTAHWDVKGYTVTLHTNGGTGGTDLTSYDYGTGAVLPTNWTKTGYVFDGWYDNESCTGTAVSSISASDTGNREYWAKWTDNIAPVIGTLAKTLTVHIAGKDSTEYTNVKSIKLKKSSYTLKKGGTVTLRPKAVLYDKKKKQLSVNHTKEFRYLSSNKKVATVSKKGKIKAVGKGTCTIYVYARNGYAKKIKVTVK